MECSIEGSNPHCSIGKIDMEKATNNEVTTPLMTSREEGQTNVNKINNDDNIKENKNSEFEAAVDALAEEPPDGGWGWCVVFASTICTMVMCTQGPCFGIFYGQRVRELGASPTLVAWIFNFQSAVWNISGPWAGLLSEKFTYRPVAMISAILAVSSLIVSAGVTNPYCLLVTFSILSGVGGGICINCCYHMTAKYFKKRLGLANGIMVTGGSVGLMLMPQMASYLQQIYTFEWATLIAGAIMMNAAVVTAFFHPVEWHTKKNNKSDFLETKIQETEKIKKINAIGPVHKLVKQNLDASNGSFTRSSSVPHHLLHLDAQRNVPKPSHLCRKRRCSESPYLLDMHGDDVDSKGLGGGQRHELKLSQMLYGSSTIMGSVLTVQRSQQGLDNDSEIYSRSEKSDDIDQGVWKRFLSHYKPSVLRDPMVICIALCTCITITSTINILATIPFVLNDAGYSLQSAASSMTVAATADLVTRMTCAVVTDKSWIKPRILYGVAQLICISAAIALVYGWSQWYIVIACMSSIGVGLGIQYVLDVFIIIRILGVQKLQSVFGMSQLFRVIAFSAIGPVGGILRDTTGSYASSILFYALNIFLGFLVLCFTAFYTWYRSKNSKTQSTEIGT